MSREPIDVVRRQFEAANERDWQTVMDLYDEDVQLHLSDAFPEAGSFSGREAVGRWFGDWLGSFEPDYTFRIDEARTISNSVFLLATHRGRGKQSGIEVETQTAYAYWVRRGKIVRVELFGERSEALEAVGLSEQAPAAGS